MRCPTSRKLLLNPIIWSTARAYHHLLPLTDGKKLQQKEFIETLLVHAGIHRIAFIRHGETNPALHGIDFNRQLNDSGILQARQAGASYGRTILPPLFPLAMASPAPRTINTAKEFLKATGLDIIPEIVPIDIAYDGTMQPEGSTLIGYGPIRAYLENKDTKDRETSQRLFAHDIAKSILQIASSRARPSTETTPMTLLFFGHAVYLPSAALGVASLAGVDPEDTMFLLDDCTKEAEGYLVHLESKACQYLSRE